MSFLDNLMARYGEVLAEPKPPTATDAIPHDRFDAACWDEVRADVPAIDQTITELSTKHDYVEDFARDTFNLVVKGDPTVRDAADMAATHVPNRTMVDNFARTPEVQQLRSLTANDPYAAAMAFVSMQSKITQAAESMSEARERAKEAEQARQEAEQARQDAEQALAQAQAQEAAVGPDDVEAAHEAALAAEAAQEAAEQAQGCALGAEQAREAAQASAESAAAGQRAGVRRAAKEATEEAEAEQALMDAFGVEPGEVQRMSFAERAAMAERLRSNRMSEYTSLIGQFKTMAAAQQRRRVAHAADEIVGVTLGDDLQRLTMGELVNMATPELEDDFWLRYAQRELVVYDLAGTEKLGQGPIVVVCDESGSMNKPLNGESGATREAWSKALSLALLDQARRQGRDFTYIGFSNAEQQYSLTFPRGRGPVNDVLTLCEHFFGGGTDYDPPLRMALDVVEAAESARSPKPDIVFITDERAGALSQDFMARWHAVKARLSTRCFGVAMVPTVNGALQAIADDVRVITDLTADPRHVADVFRMI